MGNFSFCAVRFPISKFKQKVSNLTVTGRSKLKQQKTHVECQYMFGFDRNVLTQLKPLTVQIEVIKK